MVYPVVLFVLGIALFWMASCEVRAVRSRYFALAAWPLIFFLVAKTFGWAVGAARGYDIIMFLPIAALAAFPAGCYLGVVAGEALYDIFDFFSLAGLKVKKTFDQADAAMQRHDYDEAERLYRAALKDNQSNVELRRRLVELYVTTRRLDEALGELREVGRLSERPEDVCLAAFERAEILADEKEDVAAAIEEIRAVLASFPDSTSAVFARERLAQLERRLEA